MDHQVAAEPALIADAEDLAEPRCRHIQRPVQIIRPGRKTGEAIIVTRHEARQKGIARRHVADAYKAQFLDQTILQGAICPFDAALRLGGVGTQDLDVQFRQGAAELRHGMPLRTSGRLMRKMLCLSE